MEFMYLYGTMYSYFLYLLKVQGPQRHMKSTIVRRVASYIRKPPTIVRKCTRGNMLRMGEARHTVKDAVHRAYIYIFFFIFFLGA
jgi:hypothetical protein